MLESIFSAIFLYLVCACRTWVIFFGCNTLVVCAIPSSILVGELYSNLLSTYCLLPGCRFEGLLNRNLSGCPFLMTWMYEAWWMWTYCSNYFHWIEKSSIRIKHPIPSPTSSASSLTLSPANFNYVHHHKTIATKTACRGCRWISICLSL